MLLNQKQYKLFTRKVSMQFFFQYKKPKVIIDMEKQIKSELKKLKAAKDGDVDCTPS